jgi:hypothetical protein
MTSYPFERNSDSWATIGSSGHVQINAILRRGNTKLRILLLAMILLTGASSFAQSPVQEFGDEKEP